MKNYFYKRITITVIILCVFIQMLAVAYISASETTSVYKKTDAYSACGGKQGYDGWYFMYKNPNTGECEDMTWIGNYFKGIGDERVNEHFIVPGYDTPTVVGWTAPYTGTVTLTAQDNTVYRNGPNPSGEDVTATLRLNDEILTDDNGQKTQWVFDNTCYNGFGNRTYKVTNLHINKGDMLYHEVDCGKNCTGVGIYWKPIIEYTEIDFDETERNVYFINTVTDYKHYADIANSTNPSACAKLMTDIECNGNTPQLVNFKGTIDGNNHKITLCGHPLIKSAKGGAVIKNLVLDGAVREENNAAAFIESIDADEQSITIRNCANVADICASCNNAAGFVGYVGGNSVLNIKNSYNYGLITSMGDTANAFANSDAGAFIRCENSYYLLDCTKINGTNVTNMQDGIQASAEQFASGEIAYKLNKSAGDIAFGQTIGSDAYPIGALSGAQVVYKSNNQYQNRSGLFAAMGEDSAAFCADQNAFVVIAEYDYDMLVSVQCAEIEADLIYRINLNEKSENIVRKMFVWNNSSDMVPLCGTVVYEPFTDVPKDTTIMTVSFDGKKTKCPIMLVDEYPSISIDDIAKITGGEARGNRLNISDVRLEYEADNRLAKYGDGHLMLERPPKLSDGRLYVPLSSLMPTTGWTVEYKRFEDLIIIETGTNYPEAQVTVYAKNYEIVGDEKENDRDALVAAFKAAAASAESGIPTKLELEKGRTYHLSEKQDSFALFDLDNINNFTIEGNGSTIIFERPTNSLINIEGCTNVKVNNISVEYKERIIIWGKVRSKNVGENSVNIEIPDDSPLPAEESWAQFYCTNPVDGPWIFGTFMNPEKAIHGFMPFDALMINSVEKVQGREYKVTFKDSIGNYDSVINIGDRFVFKSRWNSYDFGETNKYGRPDLLAISRSKDVTFDGIKTNGSLLMLAPVSYCDGRIIFRNCEMKPTNGDLITSAADGIHAGTNRFGIIVENCEFANSLDDLVNTQTHCGNVEKNDEYTFETSRDMFCKIGDEIKFFNSENHAVTGRAFLKAIEETEDGKYRLTLDRAVRGIVSSEEADNPTVAYNMNAANNGNIIRNNTFANSRRHAYIIRSANSIIENNYMENNAGAATEAANEIYGGANEGLFPSSLTFRNNIVKSEGISSKYTPLSIYSWYARQGEQKAIDGVLIENNAIDVPSINGSIKINSVNDLYMLNNTIKSDSEFDKNVTPITISNSSIAKIDGVEFSYKQDVSAVISITGSKVKERDITNINIIGENTAVPYSIK